MINGVVAVPTVGGRLLLASKKRSDEAIYVRAENSQVWLARDGGDGGAVLMISREGD